MWIFVCTGVRMTRVSGALFDVCVLIVGNITLSISSLLNCSCYTALVVHSCRAACSCMRCCSGHLSVCLFVRLSVCLSVWKYVFLSRKWIRSDSWVSNDVYIAEITIFTRQCNMMHCSLVHSRPFRKWVQSGSFLGVNSSSLFPTWTFWPLT